MPEFYDLKAPKKPTNLSINSDLLLKARKSKINLSATLERALVQQLRQTEREKWKNGLLEELNSRVVIPFSTPNFLKHRDAKKLCPIKKIEDKEFVLLTHQITTVPNSILNDQVVDVSSFSSEIIIAIDLLFTGI
jgi:post-segregation antitoxin (ccd killing protein)